jgi:hypothetical protein
MAKRDTYRAQLRALESWDVWLQQESGLPGPRANLELAAAVAEAGSESFFQHCLALDIPAAPANTPLEFLIFCGIVGYVSPVIETSISPALAATVLHRVSCQRNVSTL